MSLSNGNCVICVCFRHGGSGGGCGPGGCGGGGAPSISIIEVVPIKAKPVYGGGGVGGHYGGGGAVLPINLKA